MFTKSEPVSCININSLTLDTKSMDNWIVIVIVHISDQNNIIKINDKCKKWEKVLLFGFLRLNFFLSPFLFRLSFKIIFGCLYGHIPHTCTNSAWSLQLVLYCTKYIQMFEERKTGFRWSVNCCHWDFFSPFVVWWVLALVGTLDMRTQLAKCIDSHLVVRARVHACNVNSHFAYCCRCTQFAFIYLYEHTRSHTDDDDGHTVASI